MTRALIALAATTAIAQAAAAQDRVVNVYNWSDYIDQSILDEFTEETGIEVVYDVFDSNEFLETKLLAGNAGYDVVVPTGTFLARQIQAGVFRELDKSQLSNLDNMWGEIEERVAANDPGNAHSVNYMWGTTGIGYNVEAVRERLGQDEVTSWDVVFDPEIAAQFEDCGITLLDAPEELIPAALNHLGLDPDSRDPGEIERAGEVLEAVRPYVRQFDSSAYISGLANGDVCLAVGWSGDVFQAADRAAEADNGVEVGYSIPEEGALMWFDQLAIPADAPHPEEAHAFIDYMMRPEVIAKASNYVYYANGNEASKPLLEEDVAGNPAIYPSDEVMERLYITTPVDPRTQRVFTRTFTDVKTGG